ncbi:hypothetical protein PtA15_3A354 [Puccinia triticina]|uniref:Uncharacterized protein n=1 Tax=Puccinia triticina TaxID=208348 RepID=A0ABY7CCN6_9BASI|nr:uncharacterized protein PtA15_3A354 [Puccinia triticina]WAQ82988.1 hypothetical protein PtA15_3A354 [Puccinia triticina]
MAHRDKGARSRCTHCRKVTRSIITQPAVSPEDRQYRTHRHALDCGALDQTIDRWSPNHEQVLPITDQGQAVSAHHQRSPCAPKDGQKLIPSPDSSPDLRRPPNEEAHSNSQTRAKSTRLSCVSNTHVAQSSQIPVQLPAGWLRLLLGLPPAGSGGAPVYNPE